MSKEKTHPTAATVERVGAELEAGQATKSYSYYNDPPRGCQVAGLLGIGRENGTKLTELVRITGKNERVVRQMIQRERKCGILILADNENGYFLPRSLGDIQQFCRSMRHRSAEIAAVTHIAERALATMTGQETIEGW